MVVEKAYAKINLGLEVERKREDNYHDLKMVMTSISLSDELFFEELDNEKIEIDSPQMDHIRLEENLIYKAAKLIKEKFNIDRGVKIKVVKNIPEQAGLGGGSADAAATLRGLNKLWGLGLSLDELANIAIGLGSDVPFCIYNKTAKVTGRGEIIEFIDDVPYLNLILVIPPFKASTADVFNGFKIHNRNKGKIEKLIKAIETKDIDDISENLFNDLEYSYFFREISKIKSNLLVAGAKASLMTGSGSTVFGICLNEKDAVRINNRYLQSNKSMTTLFVQTRSNVRYKWSGQARQQVKYKTLASTRTKVYGRVPLIYQKLDDDYITIESPLNIYNEIFIEKLNHKISEVYFNEYLETDGISTYLEKLVDNLEYGLRVKIKEGVNKSFDLFSAENYIAQIINSLSDFGENVDLLFSHFNSKVKAYKTNNTFHYETKADSLKILEDAPFGYVLVADLDIKGYNNPRYTKQIVKAKEVNRVIEAIKDHNFYELSENLHNSLAKFEARNIERYSSLNINKIKNDCLKFGAQGFILSVDGRSIICFGRYEKHLISVRNILRNFHNIRKTIITSLKSNVVHQVSKSKVLKELVLEDELVLSKVIEPAVDLFKRQIPKEEDYSRYDYDDFDNPFGDDIVDRPSIRTRSKEKTERETVKRDIEGILHIHSGGSLFKMYDFQDIAKYFNKYFHNKRIEFEINDESYTVGFKTDNLPHLLGIHKINPDDEELRGRRGYEKLLNGEFSYRKLKNTLDEKVFKQIVNRTQGSVLIFNDIFHGRDREFIGYDNEIIFRDESKLKEKLKYGITRGVARNKFHTRNVLGIGSEDNGNINYFITSFLWDAQASLGKKEGHKVKIVKNS